MKTEKLSLYYAPHRKELAAVFGWRTVLERWIARIEKDIAACTHGDARHPSHRLQKALHEAKLELIWLDHPNNPANREG